MPQPGALTTNALTQFSEELRERIEHAPVPGLSGGPNDPQLSDLLRTSDAGKLLPSVPANRQDLCLSGLWLLAGDLDRSHTLSQSIDSAEGAFWHGIMHRREGDFGNSKYWFRRVGTHPVIEQLREREPESYQDPFEFVDACQRAVRNQSSSTNKPGDASHNSSVVGICERIQWLEWQLLFAHCLD